jgi:hypothetical protein
MVQRDPTWWMRAEEIKMRAASNYMRAAAYVVDNADMLPLSRETADTLNRMVNEGLLPENVPDQQALYRVRRRSAKRFLKWLESPKGERLGQRNPVALAERIHDNLSYFDAYLEGNGRTARLLADLALVKYGRAPALHTDIMDYFAHGSPNGPTAGANGRRARARYFQERADSGAAAIQTATAQE